MRHRDASQGCVTVVRHRDASLGGCHREEFTEVCHRDHREGVTGVCRRSLS